MVAQGVAFGITRRKILVKASSKFSMETGTVGKDGG